MQGSFQLSFSSVCEFQNDTLSSNKIEEGHLTYSKQWLKEENVIAVISHREGKFVYLFGIG